MDFGPWELLIVLALVLLLFGGAKLPKLARSLGEAGKEFRKGVQDGAADDDATATGEPPADAKPKPNS